MVKINKDLLARAAAVLAALPIVLLALALIIEAIDNLPASSNKGTSSSSNTASKKTPAKMFVASEEEYDSLRAAMADGVAYFYILKGGASVGDYRYGRVTGTLWNASGKDLAGIQIRIGIYSNSVKVDSCSDTLTNLARGGTWAFSAYCDFSRGNAWKIEDVVYW